MNKIIRSICLFATGLGVLSLVGCANMSTTTKSNATVDTITKAPFGQMPDGRTVDIYTLRNSKGAEACILTYGGIVQKLTMPDRNGQFADIVLGFDNLQDYINKSPYFGALIGRFGNRIGGGQFTLDGHTYILPKNDHGNTLHGGLQGFDKRLWKVVKADVGPDGPELELNYLSKDGEEGFPGNLNVFATYTLTDDNALKLVFTATTDKPTVVNLTHHSYFNLSGQGSGSILDDLVYINSDEITAVNSELIPTGQFENVTGTPFDFRTPTAIGARINEPNEELQYGPGYDFNWVINKPLGQFGLMARVTDPKSGRVLEVWSDQPGLQFYTGNFLDGTLVGKDGKVYTRRSAFTMEPQDYPDAPNHPNFPSCVLRPGQTYHNTIEYKFSVE
ncbi:MAG TPA: aldose epimerase family protein [Verrucomicrobiae bacterium]|nr:aldose epimerase family protein [Verrucomicrobiae bacterium]